MIFALIRTPLHDGKDSWRGGVAKDAAKKKGAKVAKDEVEPLVLDDDWIAEHARQVSISSWCDFKDFERKEELLFSYKKYA